MKIAVITDLHANREAVEAVLEHAAAQGAVQHALLGDFVGYGADPGWVVDRVRGLVQGGAWAVLGNHDEAVVYGARPSMRIDARFVVDWTRARLDAGQLEFLSALPLTQSRGELLFVHANAWQPGGWEYVQGRADAVRSLEAARQRITFCGHVHEPMLYRLSSAGEDGEPAEWLPLAGEPIPLRAPRRWLAIPGSAGQPRDGDPAACYAIYDDADGSITYWRVPYDVAAAVAKMRAAGLPQSLAARLADGH
jgi:diadenosine tetraphosphatase ApaH/serine/threonine PP2A family protein phosphatase